MNRFGAQRIKDHDLVDTVHEFRTEVLLHFLHHGVLHLVGGFALHRLDIRRAEVTRHDDHGVLKVHRPSLTVRHTAVVQHLQENVEDVGMRFFNFIEQNDGVRVAPHGFREVAPFFVADVSRRRTDQTRNGVLFHEFTHINTDHGFIRIKEEFRKRLRQFGLTDARGPQEEERTVRPVGIGQPRTAPENRFGYAFHGFILTDDALFKRFTHVKELLTFAFHHLRYRNPRGAAHDFGDFLGTHARS